MWVNWFLRVLAAMSSARIRLLCLLPLLLPLVLTLNCPCNNAHSCKVVGNLDAIPKSLRILNEPYTHEGKELTNQTIAVNVRLRILGYNATEYGFVYNDTSLKIEWVPHPGEVLLPAVLRPKLYASKPNKSDVVILTLKFPDLLLAQKTRYRLTIFNAFNADCRQTATFKPAPMIDVVIDCGQLKSSNCRRSLRRASVPKCGFPANVSTALLKKHGNWDAEVDLTIPKGVLKYPSALTVYYSRCTSDFNSKKMCAMNMKTLGVLRFCQNISQECGSTFLFRLNNVGFIPYALQVCVGGDILNLERHRLLGRRLKLPISQDPDQDTFPGWKSFVGYGILLTVLFILLGYTLAQKHRQKKLLAPSGKGKDYWELDESDIQIDFNFEIGSGTFTGVYKGVPTKESRAVADGPVVLDEQSRIAVKIMHNGVTERERKLFNAEIERNKLLGKNARIVNFIGLLAMGNTPGIVMEFCAKGCLRDFLIERRIYMLALSKEGVDPMNVDLDEIPNVRREYILTVRKLIRLAFQISVGLEYLANQKLLHRDLMAKHILVTADDSVKIGQFRHATSAANYSKSLERTDVNALRWMSPEVLRAQHFSPASDVWSMGIVFYEIFTIGGFPYTNITNCDLLDRLDQGHRLENPRNAPHEIYSIMWDCWKTEPSERPNCQKIRESLSFAFDALEGNQLRIEPHLECYNHEEVARPRRSSEFGRSSTRRNGSLSNPRARASSIRCAQTESERLLGYVE
ncbi:hypothetical protein L596_011349 [Steinernema carpocapsae]|uniref:Protein kinase domain-containing protein n=2 Tax=Steinernema carpocapsae TaxID=34508 RepID=A0A4U5NTL2_STECR|nr:hypothetical protein L596_011349 [Steinernema carpocapsae]